MRSTKPAVGFIFITLLLDVLGFGLLIPVAPSLIKDLIHGSDEQAAPYVGALMSTFYTMSFLFAPALGVLSDRFGRRPVILVALLGSGLDYFAMALAPTLPWLFVTRVVNGLSGASFTVASAYVADVTPPQKRAAAFGMIGAAFGLGFVIGPVLGGLLGQVNLRLPFYVAGGLTVVNWLYGFIVLPESLPPERRSPVRLVRCNPVGAYANLAAYPLVLGLAVSLFLLNLAQFALHATWALYTEHRYHWEKWQIGMSLFAVGLGAAVVQGGLARKLIPRLGEPRSLLVGIGIGTAAYFCYGLAQQGWMIYVIVAVASLGGIAQPACQAIITAQVGPTQQGTVQGALTSMQSLAGIFGPLLGGWVFASAVSADPTEVRNGASFFVSGTLALIGLGVAAYAMKRWPPPEPVAHPHPERALGELASESADAPA
ncbi:MAG: TCR/Tet family MFS transporter [Phycisphaerales bacterium]|nr:TCR/Tet family MFS transporter [Phycisphaerales bacterium]